MTRCPRIIAMLAAFVAAMLAADGGKTETTKTNSTVQYPPAVYYNFGSLFSGGGGNDGNNSCGSFLVASRLLGTGGPYATLWLSQYISYEVEDKNNDFQTASLGNSAAMEFTSPSAGLITFDFLAQDVPKSDAPLKQPFPFTVTSTALKDGIFTMKYTIALPGCTLEVKGKYRSLQ